MRHTSGHTGNRRSHHALKGQRFTTCAKCGAQHLMHRVCMQCGTYRGRMVVDVLKKSVKLAKKKEARKGAPKTEVKSEGKVKDKEAKIEKKETKKQ